MLCFSVSSFGEVNFSGHIKTVAVTQEKTFEAPRYYQSQNNLRLIWDSQKTILAWEIHYEFNPTFISREGPDQYSTLIDSEARYRISDIAQRLDKSESRHMLTQNLDRFNIQMRLPHGDLTLGRQAITFGSSRVIVPTDIFVPFDVRVFDQEYRMGVDAIRYQSPIGEVGEFDMGIVFGESRQTSAAFMQISNTYSKKDLHITVLRFAEKNLLGFGLETALGQFGFWVEAAKVFGQRKLVRASSGFDYAFSDRAFGQIEYHYNGVKLYRPQREEKYLRGAGLPVGVVLQGEHYLTPSFSYQLGPLWTIGFQGIFNLSDHSSFLSMFTAYNLRENLDANFTYYHFQGHRETTEYGVNPDMVYFGLSYYF